MTRRTLRIGRLAALLNVLGFIVLLATQPTDYEWLRARDAERNAGGMQFMSSADPIDLAGRPFYSSAHTPVPIAEDLFFIANLPVQLAMLTIGLPLAAMSEVAGGGVSGARESWVLAMVFGVASAIWGFLVGAGLSRFLRGRRFAA